MTEPTVQVPVSLIERIEATTNALRHMPVLQAGSGIPDITFNLNVVTEHFNAIFAAVDEATALPSQPTPSAEPCSVAVEHAPHEWDVNEGEVGFGSRCPGVAAPPSIADMAPGTTFIARFRAPDAADEDHFTVMNGLWVRASNTRWSVQNSIDPSTIRDVTPPSVTS